MILLSPMPVDFFNSLTDVEYSNLLIEAFFLIVLSLAKNCDQLNIHIY